MKYLSFSRAAALAFLLADPAFGQVYPTSNPTYQPDAVKPVASLTVPGDVAFTTHNIGTMTAEITGTFTGMTATLQGSADPLGTASPVWKNISVLPQSSTTVAGKLTNITLAGNYTFNASAYTQVRLDVTALTVSGSNALGVNFVGSPGTSRVTQSFERRATYSASVTALATAASATDFVTLKGSASTTVRVTHAECSGIAATQGIASVQAIVRSTADTAGTPATMVTQKHDSLFPAGTAVAQSWTANPTLGTSTALLRSGTLMLPTAATSVTTGPVLIWDFGREDTAEVVLRGVAQQFALNGAGATLAAGAALNCSVTWTEE